MKIKQMAERLNSVPVRKKAKRLLALTLAVLMVNPVTGYGDSHLRVFAIDEREVTGTPVSRHPHYV